jgi:hypothetical protein
MAETTVLPEAALPSPNRVTLVTWSRAWALRPMGPARGPLLARILPLSPVAPIDAARIFVPQIAGAVRRLAAR